jgi:hypothetical protein
VPRGKGAPAPPSFRGVLIRALIVAALFFPYIIFVGGAEAGSAAGITLAVFALMIPLGMLLDRLRYRMQLKRWQRQG